MPDSWGVINLTFSAPGKPAYRQSVNFFRQLRGSRQWRSSLIRSIFKGLRDLRPLPSEKNSDRLSQTKHQCAAFGRTCLPPSPSRQLLIFLVFWALGARLRFGWRWAASGKKTARMLGGPYNASARGCGCRDRTGSPIGGLARPEDPNQESLRD